MREKLENVYLAWEMNVADRLGKACWMWKNRFMESFVEDEKGDTNMVSIVVIIVIILAAAAIFKDALMGAVRSVMEKFTEFIG